jgi:hypothetical protein
MKKHIIIALSSLILSSSLNASLPVSGEHCFRPAFQKKLKRVSSIKKGSFRSLSLNKKVSKKEVFIDWRKLYWGKLKDLIYSEEETYLDDAQGIAGTEEQNISSLDTEESQAFAKELRQELKSFARQYGLKIVWRKKSLNIKDGTAAFLEYWDRGFSQEDQSKALPFAELCALSSKDTSVKDKSAGVTVTAGKITNSKSASVKDQIMYALFSNPFLKKGA